MLYLYGRVHKTIEFLNAVSVPTNVFNRGAINATADSDQGSIDNSAVFEFELEE